MSLGITPEGYAAPHGLKWPTPRKPEEREKARERERKKEREKERKREREREREREGKYRCQDMAGRAAMVGRKVQPAAG